VTAVCAALAPLFAFIVLAPPVDMHINYTTSGWNSR
jgi:hypothetical protein